TLTGERSLADTTAERHKCQEFTVRVIRRDFNLPVPCTASVQKRCRGSGNAPIRSFCSFFTVWKDWPAGRPGTFFGRLLRTTEPTSRQHDSTARPRPKESCHEGRQNRRHRSRCPPRARHRHSFFYRRQQLPSKA